MVKDHDYMENRRDGILVQNQDIQGAIYATCAFQLDKAESARSISETTIGSIVLSLANPALWLRTLSVHWNRPSRKVAYLRKNDCKLSSTEPAIVSTKVRGRNIKTRKGDLTKCIFEIKITK